MLTVHCFFLNPLSNLLQQAHSSNKVIRGAAPNLVPNDLAFNFFHIIKFVICENLLLIMIQFTGQEKKPFTHKLLIPLRNLYQVIGGFEACCFVILIMTKHLDRLRGACNQRICSILPKFESLWVKSFFSYPVN